MASLSKDVQPTCLLCQPLRSLQAAPSQCCLHNEISISLVSGLSFMVQTQRLEATWAASAVAAVLQLPQAISGYDKKVFDQ